MSVSPVTRKYVQSISHCIDDSLNKNPTSLFQHRMLFFKTSLSLWLSSITSLRSDLTQGLLELFLFRILLSFPTGTSSAFLSQLYFRLTPCTETSEGVPTSAAFHLSNLLWYLFHMTKCGSSLWRPGILYLASFGLLRH